VGSVHVRLKLPVVCIGKNWVIPDEDIAKIKSDVFSETWCISHQLLATKWQFIAYFIHTPTH